MSSKKSSGISYTISVVVHILTFVLFLLINMSFDYAPNEFVELSFGNSEGPGSSGGKGNQIDLLRKITASNQPETTKEENRQVNEVNLPVAKNTSEENIIKPADTDKKIDQQVNEKIVDQNNSEVTTSGLGNEGEGEGGMGFDIDWGGRGTRKIYSFILPQYPEGVKKEVNIKLQFTILPDGTVGTIIPKMKADTRLENAAINSLRQWRFEALSSNQRQVEQNAVIVFPYRLQ
jgi:protein TonB